MFTVRDHRLVDVRDCPSPNADARPEGAAVELVVVHGISLPPGCFGTGDVDDLFTNRLSPDAHPDYPELCAMRVSSHLLIARDGAVAQYVPFDRRAWHAGVSEWRGRSGCNDFAVGIELEGADRIPYTEVQYRVLADVIRSLRAAYGTLADDAVVGHADIAPGRKTDPGPAFDWAHLWARLS